MGGGNRTGIGAGSLVNSALNMVRPRGRRNIFLVVTWLENKDVQYSSTLRRGLLCLEVL